MVDTRELPPSVREQIKTDAVTFKERCRLKMVAEEAVKMDKVTKVCVKCEEAKTVAIAAILTERNFQDVKWRPISESGHTLGEWILIAEAELAEAKMALIKGGSGRNSVRAELVQTAAVILAALEQHGVVDEHDGRQL